MAGGLLAGISGFKKNDLAKTETVDKSAPVAAKSGPGGGAGAGSPPKPSGGGGPFGIPAGGIAGLKAQQATAAGMFFLPTLLFPFLINHHFYFTTCVPFTVNIDHADVSMRTR